MVVRVSRMRDGSRRITQISEVLGTEGEVITMQDLFVFEYEGEDADGRVLGSLKYTGVRPKLLDKARYHGLDQALMQALASADDEAEAARAALAAQAA